MTDNGESSHASPGWAIQTQGLIRSFGDHFALRGVDLEVRRGERVVIFGPNGAGKTTLIKVLSTILNPSSGRVMIGGLDLKSHAEEARYRIGVVTHHTYLYGNLTAYENLQFYSRMYDVPKARERIHDVVAMVGMTSRLHDRVGTLSRGMQQRLSIARCLLHKPAIILLDEPETGLDPQAVPMVWRALEAEGGTEPSIVLTTHNLERGFELGERLLILAKGQIVYQKAKQALSLAELKQAYQDYAAGGEWDSGAKF
ncbi:MAG: ABC transporter ATP-binding protein [Chloroflexi bacterium]|nr:ABC transporter ATP-binding protein [Chloroflexota bacterium]